jgi:hypothetical protein
MKMVQDFYRKVSQLDDATCVAMFDDPAAYAKLHPSKIQTIRSNPLLESGDECGQILGICDSTVIGGICPMPLQVVADRRVYSAICGSSLMVIPEARITGYGIDVLEKMRNLCSDRIDLSCGLSADSRKLLKFLDRCLFPVGRHLMIRRSREFTDHRKPFVAWRMASFIFDVAFYLHRLPIRVLVAWKMRGLKVRQIEATDSSALDSCVKLVEQDKHRFRQNITAEWFRWVLTNEFRPVEKANKRLYGVYRGEILVGFWISKTDTHGDRGRIIEWQVSEEWAALEPWVLLKAALRLLPFCNVVNLDTDNEVSNCLFKKLGFLQVPGQVCGVGADDGSRLRTHEGWSEQHNWRIRMSMADAAFW